MVQLVRASPSERLDEPSGEVDAGDGQQPTEEQLEGVRNAFAHRLSVITGGPGTGKTASIRTIATLAAGRGARVLLVAPTGRAAIRMTEASGVRAKTVHSALGWIPGEGPTHDEQDPLPCDLLILDESSMANLELLVTLLRGGRAPGPRGARRRRRPAGAGRGGQAVRRAGRVRGRADDAAAATSSARRRGA